MAATIRAANIGVVTVHSTQSDTFLGVMHRRALNTGNWNLAQKLIKEKEERGTRDEPADQKHAAIRKCLARPMTFYTPEEVAAMLKVEDAAVLELIWLRQLRAIRDAGKCSNREIARPVLEELSHRVENCVPPIPPPEMP